jgi:hypothetical protein
MTDKDKLIKLIDAVNEWAGRPTKDGAKNLRDLAYSLDPRNGDSSAFSEESVNITAGGAITQEIIEEAAIAATKKGGHDCLPLRVFSPKACAMLNRILKLEPNFYPWVEAEIWWKAKQLNLKKKEE